MSIRLKTIVPGCLAVLLLSGCRYDLADVPRPGDGAGRDAPGVDAVKDAPSDAPDAKPDMSMDMPRDTRPDASPDKGQMDAPLDKGVPDQGKPDANVPDLSPPDSKTPDLTAPDSSAEGPPPGCGDGKKGPTEACDGTQLGGATCQWTAGFSGGTMKCSSTCTLDTSGCYTLLDSPAFAVATGSSQQTFPSVTFAGTHYLVVWQQDYTYDIVGRRVDTAGKVLGTADIPLSASKYKASEPQSVSDGSQHYVVWRDQANATMGYNVFGTRVTATGTVATPGGKQFGAYTKSKTSLSVAASGINYLVTWNVNYGGVKNNYDVEGTTVSLMGSVSYYSSKFVSKKQDQLSAHAASDGTYYLLGWIDYETGFSQVRAGLFKLDGTPGTKVSICTNKQVKKDVRVVFDGTNYLVVWADARKSTNKHDIYGARVTPKGTVLDKEGFPIAEAAGFQDQTRVARGGSNVMVVWRDNRYGGLDIYGAAVTKGGKVLHKAGIPIAKGAAYQGRPSVAWDGKRFLVVWEEGSNVYGVRLSLAPKPTP